MSSLLEIVAQTTKVQGVSVYGVSVAGVAVLYKQFPELAKAMVEGTLSMTPEQLLELAPEAVAHIIAAGTGNPGDEEFVAAAAALPIDTQIDFLSEIIRLTMPNGINPFVEKFAKLTGLANPGVASPVEPQATPSAKRSKS